MGDDEQYLYGGLSGVELSVDSFDLGENVVLRKTYAHLMSPYIMAFAPPGPEGYHPAPWKAARGGLGFDIHIELRVPMAPTPGSNLVARETIWWIAALIRLAQCPFMMIPVVSDHPFDEAGSSDQEPILQPFETTPRIMKPPEDSSPTLDDSTLEWVREKWLESWRLAGSHKKFSTAVKAFDYATVQGKTSSSLLALWGALEQLFSPSPGELRYRVASLLASYLEPPGEARLKLYERVKKLYDKRSTAAHTAKDSDLGPLVETYVLTRNVLVDIIDECRVPTQEDLERRLFGCD